MSEPTWCQDCAHVYKPLKGSPPWQWLCVKHKRISGMGYVAPDMWVEAEPYLRCVNVNGGACVLFERADPRQLKLETEA